MSTFGAVQYWFHHQHVSLVRCLHQRCQPGTVPGIHISTGRKRRTSIRQDYRTGIASCRFAAVCRAEARAGTALACTPCCAAKERIACKVCGVRISDSGQTGIPQKICISARPVRGPQTPSATPGLYPSAVSAAPELPESPPAVEPQ